MIPVAAAAYLFPSVVEPPLLRLCFLAFVDCNYNEIFDYALDLRFLVAILDVLVVDPIEVEMTTSMMNERTMALARTPVYQLVHEVAQLDRFCTIVFVDQCIESWSDFAA